MANAKLPLPASPTAAVYGMIVQRLQADPILKRVVKTWVVLDGDAPTDVQPADINRLPWLRITCVPERSTPITEGESISPLVFRFELAVDGTLFDDVANLWYRVERVMFPGDGSMMALKRTLLGDGKQAWVREYLTLQGYSDGKIGDAQMLSATGFLTLQRFTATTL